MKIYLICDKYGVLVSCLCVFRSTLKAWKTNIYEMNPHG